MVSLGPLKGHGRALWIVLLLGETGAVFPKLGVAGQKKGADLCQAPILFWRTVENDSARRVLAQPSFQKPAHFLEL